MDADKVIQDLNRRFAAPLPEFYKRRIVFWYDEDGEFSERLDEVALNNAKLVALTGTNNFAVKKLLTVDDTTNNYLVYCPLSYEKPEDNWLLDIEMYSEEFRADLISIWMDELGIPQAPAMRKQVKDYRKYFNAKTRRDKITGQSKVPSVPAQLHMAVMGALGGLKDVTPAAIIKEVLKAGMDINTNYLYREFVNYGADKAFWSMVKQGAGYSSDENNASGLAAWFSFLKPKSLIYLVLIVFPISLLYGFEEYIFPLFAENAGVSDMMLSSIGVIANAMSYFGASVLILFRKKTPVKAIVTAFSICGVLLMLFILNTTLLWAVLVLFVINIMLRVVDNYKIISLIQINEKDGIDGKMIQERYYAVEDCFRILQGPVFSILAGISNVVCCVFLGLLCLVSPRVYGIVTRQKLFRVSLEK